MTSLANLQVKIFGDGADRDAMLDLYRNPIIKGIPGASALDRRMG
jgi:hypothetical protein